MCLGLTRNVLPCLLRVDFRCRVIVTCLRACVKLTFANKIEEIHERSLVSGKVKFRSTSCLSSVLFNLTLFYLRDQNLRVLMCVAKNASVEINLKAGKTAITKKKLKKTNWRNIATGRFSTLLLGLPIKSIPENRLFC